LRSVVDSLTEPIHLDLDQTATVVSVGAVWMICPRGEEL
jgi:hypothetical protein